MSYFDKGSKMLVAKHLDENPLVNALRDLGWGAKRNDGNSYENLTLGDVFCWKEDHYGNPEGVNFTFECQVVGREKRYSNFSYRESKVKSYVGFSPERAYAMLGCYEQAQPPMEVQEEVEGMFYTILPATQLHRFLVENTGKQNSGVRFNAEDRYYVINPLSLMKLDAVLGRNVEEVAQAWTSTMNEHGAL